MAIKLEFLNLVVPRQRIEKVYPTGWSGCLSDHAKSIGRTIWYDDHLFRAGAMDPEMMDNLIAKWTRLGFKATEVTDEKTEWLELCVVNSLGFSQHQCRWLVVDGAERIAWLHGTERGDIAGREQFR